MASATIRKRLEPTRNLWVNVGAGPWYQWLKISITGELVFRSVRRIIAARLTSSTPMPFKDASVDLFYSEHVLEHLPCKRLLPSWSLFAILPIAEARGRVRLLVRRDLLYRKFGEKDESFFAERMGARYAGLTDAFLTLIAHPRNPVEGALVATRSNHCRKTNSSIGASRLSATNTSARANISIGSPGRLSAC